MNPEQRLTIIVEHLTVESLILFLSTVVRMLRPQRMNVGNTHRPFVDLHPVTRRCNLNRLLLPVLILLLFGFRILMDTLHDNVRVLQVTLIDGFIFLGRICLLKEDLNGHEAAVALQNFAHAVFIRKFQAVLVQMERDGCSDFAALSIPHRVGRRPVTLPVHRRSAFLITECIDLNIVRHHEHGIESKSEMTDNIVLVRLVLILLEKRGRTRKCDLRNIFFHLISRHAKPGISKADGLRFRINDDMN